MKITTTHVDGKSVLKIEGELRIATVADAKPEFVAPLAASGNVQVDLSGLGQCDTAGIQLLLMACASARANGKRFMTLGHTAAFRAALDRAGIPVEFLECAPATGDGLDNHAGG